jgi:hypothetical protein
MPARDDYPHLAEHEVLDTTGEITLALNELDRLREIRRMAVEKLDGMGDVA